MAVFSRGCGEVSKGMREIKGHRVGWLGQLKARSLNCTLRGQEASRRQLGARVATKKDVSTCILKLERNNWERLSCWVNKC